MHFIKPFLRYFDFSGRSGRAEFWQYMALIAITSMVLILIEARSAIDAAEAGLSKTPVLSSIFGLLTFIPSMAVTFRRLHDRNKSGWLYGYVLVAIVPVLIIFVMLQSFPALMPLAVAAMLGICAYSIYLIYELAQPGDWYANEYGEPDADEVNFLRSALLHNQTTMVGDVVAQSERPSDRLEASSPTDVFAQIERLAGLHAQGALTDEEFSAQKARLLGSL